MAYTPTNWQTGDTITAEKLNKMEQGIASTGGAVQVGYTFSTADGTLTFDKTWQELYNSMAAGSLCIATFDLEDFGTYYWPTMAAVITGLTYDSGNYGFEIGGHVASAQSPTGYPVIYLGD